MATTVPDSARDDRIALRIPAALKEMFSRAAAYSGMSLSSFMVSTVSDHAMTVIRERESITLTPREWSGFLEALDAPARPRPKLEAAARFYRERRKRAPRGGR